MLTPLNLKILPVVRESNTNVLYFASLFYKRLVALIDAWLLDKWVFDKVEQFLNEKDSRIFDDKVFFFLHLLGTDTHGHAKRPYSEEYMNST